MNDITQIQRAMAKAVGEQLRFTEMLASTKALDAIQRSVLPPNLKSISDMIVGMPNASKLYSEMFRPPRLLEDLTRQLSVSRALIDQVTAPFKNLSDVIQSQMAVFERLSISSRMLEQVKLSIPQISRTSFAWNLGVSSLMDQMQANGMLARNQLLSARLFDAPAAYTDFVQRTTEKLAVAPTPELASILRGSLNLAEEQLLGITDSLSNILALPEDNDQPGPARTLSAPFDQQADLLALQSVEDEEDTEYLVSASQTAVLVNLGKRILHLVVRCNEASKTSPAGAEIFKPTTRLLEVYSDLPWLVAKDRLTFADLVDCLYFIFYEGAGKDNLRFMAKHGGPLGDDDCDLIWCIKHLRNKWTRHDADHGKDKDIQKSWTELAAKFRWLGLAEYPTELDHFRELQRNLLKLAADFLTLIVRRLRLR